MNKNVFIEIILYLQKFEAFINKINKYINIDNFQELDIPFQIADLIFGSVYNSTKVDIINQWLYENGGFNAEYEEIEEFFDEYLND